MKNGSGRKELQIPTRAAKPYAVRGRQYNLPAFFQQIRGCPLSRCTREHVACGVEHEGDVDCLLLALEDEGRRRQVLLGLEIGRDGYSMAMFVFAEAAEASIASQGRACGKTTEGMVSW